MKRSTSKTPTLSAKSKCQINQLADLFDHLFTTDSFTGLSKTAEVIAIHKK